MDLKLIVVIQTNTFARLIDLFVSLVLFFRSKVLLHSYRNVIIACVGMQISLPFNIKGSSACYT